MGKQKSYETAKEQETAVLVAVTRKNQPEDNTEEYLDELAFLAETAGAKPGRLGHVVKLRGLTAAVKPWRSARRAG